MKAKKLLSFVLALVMFITVVPMNITAVTDDTLPFEDVPETWYTDAVRDVYSEGIMKGKTDVKFDPTAKITRAEVVTAFARVACTNIDRYGEELPFTDTLEGQWYSNSVGWAAACGIVAGRGDGRFSPADNITRAELASILVKFLTYMEITLPDNSKIDKFADEGTFDSWMIAPIEAVRKNGLMQGSDGKFNPRGNATRAEIAKVISNLLPETGRTAFIENGESDYIISIDKSDTASVEAAERLQAQLEYSTGATLPIVDSSESQTAKKIVLRNRSGTSVADLPKAGGYSLSFYNDVPQIHGVDAEGLYLGAVRFAKATVNGDDARFTVRTAEEGSKSYPIGKLTINGNDISKYFIAYPDGASETTITGVNALKEYIADACGVHLELKKASTADYAIIVKEKTLIISESANNDENFSVKSEGNNIVITGSAVRGTMYGCYDFLEDVLGWCFMTNDKECLLPKSELDIKDIDYTEYPIFEHRSPYNNVYLNDNYTIGNEICDKHKMVEMKWVDDLHFAHTFYPLTDWQCDPSTQPCLSDEAVYETVLKNVLLKLRADPDAQLISVTQNDNVVFCQCDKCMATYAKYSTTDDPTDGGTSGQMLEFVNRIADEVAKEFPDVYVVTFAYTYTRNAPINIKPRDNVMIQLCPLECCFNHPLDGTTKCSKGFADDMKNWTEICDNLFIWDYNNSFSYRGCPFPNVKYNVLATNLAYFADNNTMGVFAQGNEKDLSNGEFDDLRWYLVAKLLWDPYMSEEEYDSHVRKFMECYYGEGWEKVYTALNLFNNTYNECIGCFDDIQKTWMTVKTAGIAPELVSLMDEAKFLSETKTHFENTECSQIQFDYLYVSCNFNKMYKAGGESREAIVALSFALQEKMQKYQVKLSSGYPVPELTDITRPPYEWKELLDEQMGW